MQGSKQGEIMISPCFDRKHRRFQGFYEFRHLRKPLIYKEKLQAGWYLNKYLSGGFEHLQRGALQQRHTGLLGQGAGALRARGQAQTGAQRRVGYRAHLEHRRPG
jgi:hypothetical protein